MAKKKVETLLKKVELHQHDLANFLKCPRLYNLSNNLGYYPRKFSNALNIGDLFAKCAFWLHQGKDVNECIAFIKVIQTDMHKVIRNQKMADDMETNVVITQAMLNGYYEKFIVNYKPSVPIIAEILPEYKIENKVQYAGYEFTYVCRLDGKIIDSAGNIWVLEIKTTSLMDKNLIDKLPTNFQINSYWNAAETKEGKPVAGVLYRYILKPSLRQKKGETIDQYRKRIMLDYITYPDEYFYEQSIYFSRPSLDEFKADLNAYIEDLARCYILNKWVKRGTACETKFGLCPYIKYCGDPTQETLNTYFQKGESDANI